MKKVLNKNFIRIMIATIIYKILLDIIYIQICVRYFGYSGFTANSNLVCMIVSWIVLFIIIFPLKYYIDNIYLISNNIMSFLILFMLIPFLTMMQYDFFDLNFIVCNLLYWLILISITLYNGVQNKKKPIKRQNIFSDEIKKEFVMVLLLVCSFTIIYVSFRYSHFRMFFNVFDVYEYRREYDLPILIDYFLSASRLLNAIFLIYFLCKNKFLLALLLILLQLFSFGFDGMKSVLFSTGVAILVKLFFKKKLLKYIIECFIALCLLGLLEYYIFNTYQVISLLIRRLMFLTNMINYDYFKFFSINEPDYFRQSFLRYFGVNSPYKDIAYLIGETYFGKANMHANGGLISDAMQNLGYIGIAIHPLAIGVLLELFNKAIGKADYKVKIFISFLVVYYLLSSTLLTILITHGMILALLLISSLYSSSHIGYKEVLYE